VRPAREDGDGRAVARAGPRSARRRISCGSPRASDAVGGPWMGSWAWDDMMGFRVLRARLNLLLMCHRPTRSANPLPPRIAHFWGPRNFSLDGESAWGIFRTRGRTRPRADPPRAVIGRSEQGRRFSPSRAVTRGRPAQVGIDAATTPTTSNKDASHDWPP
jgi:hypothetical protein